MINRGCLLVFLYNIIVKHLRVMLDHGHTGPTAQSLQVQHVHTDPQAQDNLGLPKGAGIYL